jgi:hypothetical protein
VKEVGLACLAGFHHTPVLLHGNMGAVSAFKSGSFKLSNNDCGVLLLLLFTGGCAGQAEAVSQATSSTAEAKGSSKNCLLIQPLRLLH